MGTESNPFRGAVDNEVLTKWIAQFSPDEHDIVEQLLNHFRFYDPSRVNAGVRTLHTSIVSALGVQANSIFYVPVGYVAKSGAVITYLYKTQNDIPQDRFILPSDLA